MCKGQRDLQAKSQVREGCCSCRKKKKELPKMVGEYKHLKVDRSKENFKWTIAKLNIAIKCKTHLDDKPRPKGKEALLERWGKIKRRPTPQPSPEGSDNEDASDDDDDAVGHGVAHGVLVFRDEPDSDLGGESELDESIDEENCTSVEGV
jgi:hypothetical protein